MAEHALLLRVDCEHSEALRWTGSKEIEARGIERLLDLLEAKPVRATFAFVGETAAQYPGLARAVVAGDHAVVGHSNRHCRAYAGQVEAWQWRDMREMIDAIEAACGVRVNGLAAPCHGAIDQTTLRAAAMASLRYVLNTTFLADGEGGFGPAAGGPPSVHVPPASMRVVWDWTALQTGWPPFTQREARRQWIAALDEAARERALVSLIVHPWIVETNNEYALLADILDYARTALLPFATFDQVATAVDAESAVPVGASR